MTVNGITYKGGMSQTGPAGPALHFGFAAMPMADYLRTEQDSLLGDVDVKRYKVGDNAITLYTPHEYKGLSGFFHTLFSPISNLFTGPQKLDAEVKKALDLIT